MKIAVIGNSHTAMLARASTFKADVWDGCDVDFFGAQAQDFTDLVVDGTRLVPQTERLEVYFRRSSDGKIAIDLQEYDAVVLAGLRSGTWRAIQLFARYGVIGRNLLKRDFRVAISEAMYRQYLKDDAGKNYAACVAGLVRSASQIKMLLMPDPDVSEKVIEVYANLHLPRQDWPYYETIRRYLDEAILEMAARYEMAVISQPSYTKVGHIFTKREYQGGPINKVTDPAVIERDVCHMNPEFGAMMVEEILSTVRATA